MATWKEYKEGDPCYLSVVYKDYGGGFAGYYLTMNLEPGDFYIPVYELGKPKVKEDAEHEAEE